MTRALPLALALGFAFYLSEVAPAAVLPVNPDGSGEFPTIQAALDDAAPGDTISLGDGTFQGPGNREIEIVMSITLMGQTSDPSRCVLECDGLPGFHVPQGGSVDLSLSGLTVRGSSAGVQLDGGGQLVAVNCEFSENTGHAIECNSGTIYLQQSQFLRNEVLTVFARESRITALHCSFIENHGTGLRSEQAHDTRIEDCVFRNNVTAGDGGGLAIGGEDFPVDEGDVESPSRKVFTRVVARCSFEDNFAGYGGGGLWIEDTGVTVEDCSFRDNYGGLGGGMGVEDFGSTDVHECEFIGNRADLGGAVGTDTPFVELTNCVLMGNQADEGGAIGLRLWGGVTVVSSEIRANFADVGGVCRTRDSSFASFVECVIVENQTAQGSIFRGEDFSFTSCTISRNVGNHVFAGNYLLQMSHSIFSRNDVIGFYACPDYLLAFISCTNIYGHSGGDWIGCLAEFENVDGNMSADPLFCNPTAGDYSLAIGSPCLDENNDPDCGTMGAFADPGCEAPIGAVLLVRPDGSGDVPTIQAAIDAAVDRDTVSLANGVFSGPGNRDLDFLGKQIVIRSQSGSSADCVIDCGGTSVDPHRAVSFVSGETAASVLEGVTITGGAAFGAGVARFGGAIYCAESSPTIRHCILEGNTAERNGGAINLFHSNAIIEDCMIRGNEAPLGAGVNSSSSAPLIRRTQITGNVASESGGGLRYFSQFGASPQLQGATLSGNESPLGGGIACLEAVSLDLGNSIVWGNCAEQGRELSLADAACEVTVHCSDVDTSGVWQDPQARFLFESGDNLSVDPAFCDPIQCDGGPTVAGAFTLDASSPCSPANSPDSCGLIGAHGVNCDATAEVPAEPASVRDTFLLRGEPNPFSKSTRIRLRMPAAGAVEIVIYDITGKRVRALKTQMVEGGEHVLEWDGTDDRGHQVPTGNYWCRVTAEGNVLSGTVTRIGR